ncbi:MAG: oligosaccharide flippase family protein [Microgenomates group bacterium]
MEVQTEVDFEEVKQRFLVGVLSLISRSFLIQIISQASLLLLTIFLDPKTFGVFFLVSAFINFFAYFSDIGLAAALIQKKDKLTEEDLKTTFFVQQILVVGLLIVIFLVSPLAGKWYGFDKSALYLLYSLGFSFFLSSLKTIPSVLLERQLKFNLLVIPQILETLVFNVVSVILAWQGFGLAAFTWAVLARGIVGLVIIYLLAPWKMGFAFSRESLHKLLRFGIPYQANTIMAVAKDDLMTIFLGKVVGATGLGYLGWAKKWAEQPLRFFMDNVSKVAFPAFSRIQDDKEKLKKSVEKSLFFLSFLTFPLLVGFSILASDLVKIIPRYLKWEPALLALYLYCFNSAWATVSTSMTNLLNAIGKIKTTFKLMVMWLVLTWALMPVLGLKFGYNGVAFASAIIALSSGVAVYVAKKSVNFDLVFSVGKPLLASGLMGLIIFVFRPSTGGLAFSVLIRVCIGMLSYLGISYLLLGKSLTDDVARIVSEFKKKH